MIAWVYGSGFPKSLDVSKAIDKAAGAEREVVSKQVTKWTATGRNERYGKLDYFETEGGYEVRSITAPATDAARQWSGWGTALKPALEPITVARKPLIGTVAENVLRYGTGAINVDRCRVEGGERRQIERANQYRPENFDLPSGSRSAGTTAIGRWPANLIHDGSEEVVGLFPETMGKVGMTKHGSGTNTKYGKFARTDQSVVNDGVTDSGCAARFFYTAKADKSDRGPGNNHPTVKPVDLMRYLVRLVCPIGGVVLDPFSGSGTTLAAAQAEGCLAIGVEREAAYCEIIKGRFHQRRLF
jgi:site-specific DNA-methyltransferase (adenine-specific)